MIVQMYYHCTIIIFTVVHPMKIVFGSYEFPTKKALIEEIRNRVNAAKLNKPMTPQDTNFFWWLIHDRHRHAEHKLLHPIKHFFVRRGDYGEKQIWMEYDNGEINDFSWRACVTPRTNKDDALAAGRTAIKPQIREFVTELDELRCAISGELVTFGDFDVDHHPVPFKQLFDEWLFAEGLTYDDIKTNIGEPRSLTTSMIVQEQELSWQQYHERYAELRILKSELHRTLKNK